VGRRTNAEIEADRAAATALSKEQVIAQHVGAAGGVPLITASEDVDVTPGVNKPEDEMIWGEIISSDGQYRQELFSVRGSINGRRFSRAQELATGVRCLVYKILIPSIEFPTEEEIRVSSTNIETEHALNGDMSLAERKCQQMGCDRVVLRGRGLVFIRKAKKFRFIPDLAGVVS
jgi:hypothetical protein